MMLLLILNQKIQNIRLRNLNKVIIVNIKIHSFPNILEHLKEFGMNHIDVLVIMETELDENFPTLSF